MSVNLSLYIIIIIIKHISNLKIYIVYTITFTVYFTIYYITVVSVVQFCSPPVLASSRGGGTFESACGATGGLVSVEAGGFGDASGGLAADGNVLGSLAPGGDTGESGPTVLTPPGGLMDDRLSRGGGKLRGAGVILAWLPRPVVPVRPVVKGSGAILRRGMLVVGDVRLGSGVRILIAGSGFGGLPTPGRGFGGLPIPGSGRIWPPIDGLGGLPPIPGSGCFGRGLSGVGRVGRFGSVSPFIPSSPEDCRAPFLSNGLTPAGAFPFPISGRPIGAKCSGLSGIFVGPKRPAPPNGSSLEGRSGMAAPVGPKVSCSVARALLACRDTSPPLTGGKTDRRSRRFGVSCCEGIFVSGGRPCKNTMLLHSVGYQQYTVICLG